VSRRFRLSRAGEFRALGTLLENHRPGAGRIGRLLERSVRLMDTATQEYINARVTVDNTNHGAIYLSEEATRAFVADAWSQLEKELQDANAAFNATADEPHERILTLLQSLGEALKYADVIYVLTPMPEGETDA
jgi:hypothetical protein